jgi:hypothetical protein
MKARLLFLFLLLMALQVVLFSAPAELDIRMFDDSKMIVVIDNYEFNENSGRYYITDLSHGYHDIDVYRVMYGLGNQTYTELFYSGRIYLQGGFLTFAEVDRGSRLIIVKKVMLNTGHGNNNNGNHYGHYNNNGNHYGHYSGGGGHYGYGGNYGHSGGGYGYGEYSYGMEPAAFAELKRSMASNSFDSNKLDFAKFAVSRNRMTSSQIYELTSMFTFESNKLEFSKFAYAYVLDPGSYFIVANAFTFSSSKRELFNFIGYGSGY